MNSRGVCMCVCGVGSLCVGVCACERDMHIIFTAVQTVTILCCSFLSSQSRDVRGSHLVQEGCCCVIVSSLFITLTFASVLLKWVVCNCECGSDTKLISELCVFCENLTSLFLWVFWKQSEKKIPNRPLVFWNDPINCICRLSGD